MARGGVRAQWEPRLAQLDRQARDRARQASQRQAREREEAQQRAAAGRRDATERTTRLERDIAALEEILTSALAVAPVSFERLMAAPETPRFDPGPAGLALVPPDWNDFAPAPSRGLSRVLDAVGRHARQVSSARSRFAAAQREHQQRESERIQALADRKARHDHDVTRERARAAARNAQLRRRKSAFEEGDPDAIRWFVGRVLGASRYPEGFPRDYRVGVEAGTVTVEFELPPGSVIPAARGYRYVEDRDEVEPTRRTSGEIDALHERLVACVALRTVHEVLTATPPDLVRAAGFDGYLADVDPASGKSVRRRLLSLRAERAVFDDLVLGSVDPIACAASLSAVL